MLEPKHDGFRNYQAAPSPRSPEGEAARSRAAADAERAEMTVLVAGLRVLGANTGGASTACSRSAPAC